MTGMDEYSKPSKDESKKELNKLKREYVRSTRQYIRRGRNPKSRHHGTPWTEGGLRIKRLIAACGGCARVMKACGVGRPCVSKWVEREDIPKKHWKVIIVLLNYKIDIGQLAQILIKNWK